MTGNEAGQSAEEQARRTREKIARLQRSADAWAAGAAGEQETGRVLGQLDPAEWRVLHDVTWPGRARANIDHVVIGPPGVFVVDSKNWSGRVAVTDGVLRQNGRSREQAVVGVAEAGITVLELVPDVPVHPVLCLVRDQPAEGWVRDVMFCSTANVVQLLTSRPTRLSTHDVPRVAAAVQAGVTRSRTAATTPARGPRAAARARAASPRRSSRRRSGPSGRRLLGALALLLLMLGALETGLLTKATGVFSDAFVGGVFDDDPPADPADQPAKLKKQRNKQNAGNGAG